MALGRLLIILAAIKIAECLSPSEWRAQSIYQVMTDRFALTKGSNTASCEMSDYCGGTWQGLIDHLDYIQDMGFTAVWISPVVENLINFTSDGNSYHGYWARDVYKLNPQFGSASDLASLSDKLHSRGMYLIVDVVTNHMAYSGCVDCIDYSTLTPFNRQTYYHPYCQMDYEDQDSIERCWAGDDIVPLPDLRTEDVEVRKMWENWVKQLVSNYSIDGLRIDSAAAVERSFYPDFERAAGVYAMGEIFDANPGYVCSYQEYLSGALNYPQYYYVTGAFGSSEGNMSGLVESMDIVKATCLDNTLLGSFLENHDNPRFPSITSDVSLIKNAVAFVMLADGIPIIYQGQEQSFKGASTPYNREPLWTSDYTTNAPLYDYIKTLNAVRKWGIEKDSTYTTYKAWHIWDNAHTIVLRKGSNGTQIVSVFNNLGSAGNASFILAAMSSGFGTSTSVTEVLSCSIHITDGVGNLAVNIEKGLPQIFYLTRQLVGSGLCDG